MNVSELKMTLELNRIKLPPSATVAMCRNGAGWRLEDEASVEHYKLYVKKTNSAIDPVNYGCWRKLSSRFLLRHYKYYY